MPNLIKPHIHALILGVFLFIVAGFGFSRAFEDTRWGGWAVGDAQNLNAAIHFSDEGFAKHFFLTYYHPGHLGTHYGTESELGYYTHYPPLSAILNGLVARFIGTGLYQFRSLSILMSIAWLVFFYFFSSILFNNKTVALISTVLIGSSVSFLDYMDGFSPYTYSEFFVYGALLSFLLAVKNRGSKRMILFALAWVMVFLESFNSFDYILFLFCFMTGYSIFFRDDGPIPYGRILIFALAPIAAFSIHLYQNMLALGGFAPAWADLIGSSRERLVFQKGTINGLAPHFFESLNLNSQLNFGWPLLELTMIPIASYLFLSFRGGKDPKVSFKPVLLMLTGILLWWGIAFGSIVLFAKVMLRQIFPIMALCISFPLLYCGDRAMKKELTLFCLLFCIPIIGHVYNTSTYLQEYPNRISPFRCWALQQQSQDMMLETIALSKKIKQNTLFGDIIFVPRQFVVRYSQPFSFCEYFSQRKLEYEGRDPEERMLRRTEISDYVRNVLPKIYGPGIKVAVYALVRIDRRNAKHQELLARTDRVKDLGDHWILYKLEDPKS